MSAFISSRVGVLAAHIIPKVRAFFRAEDLILSRYRGRAWDDTTERQLTEDIAKHGSRRF